MNDNNNSPNAITVLVSLGKPADFSDLSMTVEPNIYFLFDPFTRRADEGEWQAGLGELNKEELRYFTTGLIRAMACFWTERFSPAALALGKELSHRCTTGKGCIEGERLSKFMYAVSIYDLHSYEELSKLPGLIHDVTILDSIDYEKTETLKLILMARNRVKRSCFMGDPDELTMLEVARERRFIREQGNIERLFEV